MSLQNNIEMLYPNDMGVFDRRVKHKNGTVSVMRYIRWYLPGGKAVTRSLGPASNITKTEARWILEEHSGRSKRKARHGQMMYEDITLSEFEPIYIKYGRDIEKKRSWGRDVTSLKNLTKELGWKFLSQITVADLTNYRQKRIEEGVTPRTVNLEMSCLSKLIKVATGHGRFAGENPVSKIKQFEIHNETDRILSLDEEERLIKASPPNLRAIIGFALNTGMRRGEIISLKWKMINMQQDFVRLLATNTKSKKERKVYLNPSMQELLKELSKNKKSEYVFVNASGEPYTNANGIRTSFESAKRKAGIENLRFHDLRHTAATRMVEAGVPLFQVGQILGHTDPKTTMRYAHPDESLKDAVNALERYNRNNYSNSNNKKDDDGDVSS